MCQWGIRGKSEQLGLAAMFKLGSTIKAFAPPHPILFWRLGGGGANVTSSIGAAANVPATDVRLPMGADRVEPEVALFCVKEAAVRLEQRLPIVLDHRSHALPCEG